LIVIVPVPPLRVSAAQATITVDTLSDADDGTDGRCSIREAIIAANTNANYNECSRTGPGTDDVLTFSISGTILTQFRPTPFDPPLRTSDDQWRRHIH
jgi:CSLREA domain-containing protein